MWQREGPVAEGVEVSGVDKCHAETLYCTKVRVSRV
jgi:hypothetical protein